MNFIKSFFKEEEGQGMTEYGLILGIIAVGVIGVLVLFGQELTTKITEVKDSIMGNFPTQSGS